MTFNFNSVKGTVHNLQYFSVSCTDLLHLLANIICSPYANCVRGMQQVLEVAHGCYFPLKVVSAESYSAVHRQNYKNFAAE